METKHALLNVAEDLVRTKGMDAVSFGDLAKALGIRNASVHYHFPTKADLALALIRQYAARFLDALPEEGTSAERLGQYLDHYRDALAEGQQMCLCVSLSGSRHGLDDTVLAELSSFHAASLTWLGTVFTQADEDGLITGVKDAAAEAHQCLALVEGAQLLARAEGDPGHFDRAVALMRARLRPKETP